MASKGSKYTQKHTLSQEVEANAPTPNITSAFLDILYDDLSFLESFEALDNEDQIKLYIVLKKLSESSRRGATKAERDLIRESKYKLRKINEWSGLKKEDMLRYPLSQDEHHIIRMDCYGSIDMRPSHQLSSYYKTLREKRLKNQLPPDQYRLDSMEHAPVWQLFRQFQNFRKIEDKLKNYLSEQKYDPRILSVMGVKDFSDLIFQAFKTEPRQLKVNFVEGDNERNAFVKALAKNYGDQIEAILLEQGWDERCVFSMLNAMEKVGSTDAAKIVVTEKYFNEQILSDLKKNKIDTSNYQIGEIIPTDLLDQLFGQNKQDIVTAYDENSKPLRCPHGFEVHHKVAISESGRFPAIVAVNYRNNFLLVSVDMHRNVLHLFDTLLVTDGKEAYSSRIEFTNENTSFMESFSPKEQFEVDWEQNNDKYRQRVEEDQQYMVSYDLVMAMLTENQANFDKPNDAINLDKTVVHLLKLAKRSKRK